MDAGDSLVSHSDLRQIGILEESVIGLFLLNTEGDGAVHVGLVPSRLWQRDLAAGQHLDVATVFKLHSTLTVLGASDILDFDARTLVFLTLDRDVHINAKLSILNLCVGDAETLEEFLQLAHYQLGVVWVSFLGSRDDFKQGHASSIVVDQHFVTFVDALGGVLLHLNALNENMVLILSVVVEEEAAIEHDRVVLLSDLVRLWQVSVDVMLAVEFDSGQDAATQGETGLDCQVEALFVQDGEHAGQGHVYEVSVGVGLLARSVQRCYKMKK